MQNELDKPRRRAVQYHYIDGTFEFTFGGLCLLLAFFFFIQAAMPESLFNSIMSMVFIVIIPGGSMLINTLVNRFKERVTYPRSGYITYKQTKGVSKVLKTGFSIGVTAILGGVLAAIITGSPQMLDWMPGLTSLVFGFVLAWIGFRSSLPRFLLLGFLTILIGILLSFLGYGKMFGLYLFYGITGVILLFSGGLTLLKYLRDNPKPEEADDAG